MRARRWWEEHCSICHSQLAKRKWWFFQPLSLMLSVYCPLLPYIVVVVVIWTTIWTCRCLALTHLARCVLRDKKGRTGRREGGRWRHTMWLQRMRFQVELQMGKWHQIKLNQLQNYLMIMGISAFATVFSVCQLDAYIDATKRLHFDNAMAIDFDK